MKTLISLPTYNEKENLANLCKEIFNYAPDVDIFIIDDNSPDGTGAIADNLAKKGAGRVFVIHRTGKLGLGSAIMAGFEYAIKNGYELVINMDCDFSHDPKELPSFFNAAKSADLVIGSRHVEWGHVVGWNRRRKVIHWLAQQYTNIILGRYVHDHTNAYKAYKVSMLKQLPMAELLRAGSGYIWHTLLIHEIYKKGFKIVEVPSIFVSRCVGKSKMSKKEMFGGLLAILKMRFKI